MHTIQAAINTMNSQFFVWVCYCCCSFFICADFCSIGYPVLLLIGVNTTEYMECHNIYIVDACVVCVCVCTNQLLQFLTFFALSPFDLVLFCFVWFFFYLSVSLFVEMNLYEHLCMRVIILWCFVIQCVLCTIYSMIRLP